MANTYTLIASNTLSSSAASVTFSAIPNTYTDLVLKTSVRTTNNGTSGLRLSFNSDSSSNYSVTILRGYGGGLASTRDSNLSYINAYVNGDNTTANSFGNSEIYIPSYLVSQNKPLGISGAVETNATDAYFLEATAGLWRNTASISSFTVVPNAGNFVAGSSFFLYGIKNS